MSSLANVTVQTVDGRSFELLGDHLRDAAAVAGKIDADFQAGAVPFVRCLDAHSNVVLVSGQHVVSITEEKPS